MKPAWAMAAGAWAAAAPLFAWSGEAAAPSVSSASSAPSASSPSSPEFQLDASARADAFHATHDPIGPTDTLVLTGQVKALAKFGHDTQAKVELRASSPSSDGRDDTSGIESRVLEAYVAHQFAHADLRIGKQIVAWGRADGINPTDNLSPRDFVTWLPFEDDQRFGVWSARYDAHLPRSLDLTLFFSPRFASSLIAKPELPNPVTAPTPARNLANSQFAVKLNRSTEELDWSVSYYRGPALLPTARLLGMNALGPQLEFHHDRVQVLGADLARNFGRFGFRAEAAWTQPGVADDGAAATRRPDLYVVAGLDRTFFEHLYVNFQLFGRHVSGFVDPYAIADPAQRAVAVQNAITEGQQDRTTLGYTLRVSHKWWDDTLEAELLLIDNRTRNNRFMRPVISYAVTDRFKAMLGAVVYQGADDTAFGRKKPNNRVFVELRYAM
jgi:hypothetical protein